MFKKYALFISVFYTIALACLSLIELGELPDLGTSFGDKIFHFLAYFVLPLLWFNALFNRFKFTKTKAIVCAGLVSFVIGVIIEFIQGNLTDTRVSDIYDVGANTIGIIVAVIVLVIYKIKDVKLI
ncbi:VanZ family protein [Hyunsoonleella aestuarii]|uniref:VanZ-like domain-containing protein n=1 Tax=Hyunsoonleella aestuarii TaxID=912802 RepID=A0ABP8EA43_9FLAO|nr:VanZ family protein [Hyunsoonleella aestuarii]